MSITQKMIRDSCRSTWGADWWKTDKVSRKAIAALSLAGINYDAIETAVLRRLPSRRGLAVPDDEPILAIEDEVQVCPICMEDAITNTTTTECNHTFHSKCYTNYICSVMRSRTYGQITCPCCRADICEILPPVQWA